MALDRLTEDMNFIGGMGDDPKRDDGLSTPQFKSFFDKAGLVIQDFINNKLIPQIEGSVNEGALLPKITDALNRKLDKSGGNMTGNIDMNGQKIFNLPKPVGDNEPATKKYAEEYAKEYAERYADSLTFSRNVVLTAANWVGDKAPYTQTINVDGIEEEDTPHYGPVYSAEQEVRLAEKEAFSMVDDLDTAKNTVVFTCFEDKPEVDLTIQMEVNR